jgi:hypothetical protein
LPSPLNEGIAPLALGVSIPPAFALGFAERRGMVSLTCP